jgi:hypothetical protein
LEARTEADHEPASALRAEALRALAELQAAYQQVRDEIVRQIETLGTIHRHLDEGGAMSSIEGLGGLAARRLTRRSTVADWREARHRAERAAYRLAMAEGMSIAAVAGVMGVSRQLVSRVVNDDADTPLD